MTSFPQSCAIGASACNDVVDYTPILVGVIVGVLLVIAALIIIGVRRFTR